MPPAADPSWPFAGRGGELATIAAHLRDDRTTAVVITGDAGSGKTRLAAEALCGAALPPMWWHATPATAALPHAVLSSIVAPDELEDPAVLYRRVAAGVLDAGGVVVVDDGPHLDARSADLLRRLVDAGKARAVVTARAGVPVPGWLDWLWLGEGTRHVELGALDGPAIDDLVGAVLPEIEPDRRRRLVDQLGERTRGNALFLRELLASQRAALDRGDPVDPALATPAPLRRVLEARVADAGTGATELLAALGLFGSLSLDAAEHRFGDEVLGAAERAGLIAVDLAGRATVRPAHPLLAEAATSTMTSVARRRAVAELAGSVLGDPAATGTERLAAVAAQLDHGGAVPGEALAEAARLAFAELDHELAVRLASAALEAGDRFEAWVVLGAAHSGAGRADEAEVALRNALDAATTDDELARAAGRLSVHLVAHGPRIGEAETLLSGVASRLADPDAVAFLAADRAKLASIRGDLAAAAAALPDDGDGVAALNGAIVTAYAQAMAGDVAATHATIERALPLADAHRDVLPWSGELVRFSGVLATLAADGPAAAVAHATAELERTADAAPGTWRYLRGLAASAGGELDRADHDLARAVDELVAHDLIGARPLAIATLAWARAQAGEVAEARRLLDEALELGAADGRVQVQAAVADLWCDAVERGGPPRAAAALGAADAARAGGQQLSAVLVLHDLVRLGAAADALPPLRALAAQMPDAWLAAFARDRAEAEAGGDPVACRRLALDVTERWPTAAAELWGTVHRSRAAAGDEVGAARAAVRALTTAAEVDGPMPWTLRSVVHPLTAREQEVAASVAAGATSRATAEAAGVSVRTVEHQLQSAYRKLGLKGRAELVAWLVPDVPS
ncbi:MAG TPA: LuxR family transcriptional regulator [Aquihabitans sp.]|nr:LuxR family transcriptional regulator [Aquihabitans sp.]